MNILTVRVSLNNKSSACLNKLVETFRTLEKHIAVFSDKILVNSVDKEVVSGRKVPDFHSEQDCKVIACRLKGAAITFKIFVNVDLLFKGAVRAEGQEGIVIRDNHSAVTERLIKFNCVLCADCRTFARFRRVTVQLIFVFH